MAVNLSISSVAVIQLKETSCSIAVLLHGSIISGGSSVAHIWWVAVGLLLVLKALQPAPDSGNPKLP